MKITNPVPYFRGFGLCKRKWGIFALVGNLLLSYLREIYVTRNAGTFCRLVSVAGTIIQANGRPTLPTKTAGMLKVEGDCSAKDRT